MYNLNEELKRIINEKLFVMCKKLKYVIVIIAIILLFCSLILIKSTNSNENGDVMIFGKKLENWESWITIIAIPITASWAVHQYYKNSLKMKQEKAAEIAKLFSEELLDKCFIIGNVIENSRLKEILDLENKDTSKLQRFDRDEIIELYNRDENIFKEYREVLLSREVQLSYLYFLEKRISIKTLNEISQKKENEQEMEIIKILEGKYSKNEIEELKSRNLLKNEFERFCVNNNMKEEINRVYRKEYSDEEARALFILDNQHLPFLFSKLVSDVLNELEYICMYISSQSAGSYFVYQSIHQIFLKTIKITAMSIAWSNKDYSDKYYTNIIHVYKNWYNRRENDREKERKNQKKAYRYLNPKIKTV